MNQWQPPPDGRPPFFGLDRSSPPARFDRPYVRHAWWRRALAAAGGLLIRLGVALGGAP